MILIMFTNEDEVGVNYPHDNAFVVTLGVGPSEVSRILVDTSSSADIIFKSMLVFIKIDDL